MSSYHTNLITTQCSLTVQLKGITNMIRPWKYNKVLTQAPDKTCVDLPDNEVGMTTLGTRSDVGCSFYA
jgi:hypothetical protein